MPLYMALIVGDAAEAESDEPPEVWQQMMAEYNEFAEKANAAGVIRGGEALHPPSTATTVKVLGGKGGEVVTTDGPFAESKESIGGFFLLDCHDLDEALSWAAQIPGAWHGRVEVRPCIDFSQG